MPFCRLPTSLQFADPTGSPPLVSPQAVSPCLPWNLASLLSNRATFQGRHGESVSTPRYGRSNPSSEVGRFVARNYGMFTRKTSKTCFICTFDTNSPPFTTILQSLGHTTPFIRSFSPTSQESPIFACRREGSHYKPLQALSQRSPTPISSLLFNGAIHRRLL